MNAADVMTSPAVVVNPATTVRAASALLGDHGFSALPVVDDEGGLVGIVSGADLLPAGMTPATGAERKVVEVLVRTVPGMRVARIAC
ncbi:CBS domain-containing protein [Lentzea sp. NPDC004789]